MCELLISDNIAAAPAAAHQYVLCSVGYEEGGSFVHGGFDLNL